jgi:putative FmdB family regulatory protein
MPIYEYDCSTCGVIFEKRQSFSDPPLSAYADCPNNHRGCNIRRLVSTPAIVFKGSGFYVTDNKTSNSASNRAATEKKADTKPDKEPAKKSKTAETNS